MSKTLATHHRSAAMAAVAAIVLVAQCTDARTVSLTGRRGRTWSRTVTPYNNDGGNVGRTVTATGPNGKTATSTFNRSVSGDTITTNRTYTGFNGATTQSTVTRTPGQGASATYTGRNGQTYSATRTHDNEGDGNAERTTTVTGPNGTTTRQLTQTHNGNGSFTDTRTLTTPNGTAYTQSYVRYAGWNSWSYHAGVYGWGPCCMASGAVVGFTFGTVLWAATAPRYTYVGPPFVVYTYY